MSRGNPGRSLAAALLAVLCLCGGCGGDRRPSVPVDGWTIVALGDSITAGKGVSPEDSFPSLLARRLAENGLNLTVINAGVSGETSAGALARIGEVLAAGPQIVILETGANDALRRLGPDITRANIDETVRRLTAEGVTVVLAGMKIGRFMGRFFSDPYADIYPEVAERYGAVLVPFILDGVAGKPSLNQPDGIHPTAEGYALVLENLYPYVLEAIERHAGN